VDPQQPPPRQTPPPNPAAGLNLPTGPGGANPFGLPGGGGGGGIGGTGEGTGGAGSRFGGYAASAAATLQRCLQQNERTRVGSYQVTARLWIEPSGRVGRVQLVGTTGDAARDAAVMEAYRNCQLAAPLPDQPQPMVARVSARG
jgi:TonB family protein